MAERNDPAAPGAPAVLAPDRADGGPDLLDRTWDFLAAVPVATVLLFLVAAASVAGTLIEQEGQYDSWLPPAEYYPQRYGPLLGPLLQRLGLTHAYTSWWYLALLFLVGSSLLVCSVQRGVPLYRAIHFPPLAPPLGFLRHLRHRFTCAAGGAAPLAPVAAVLRAEGYRVTVQGDRLLAEKGRWGRWGPYVLHAGLLLILLGALGRAVPGWYSDNILWIRDGEVARVPGTDWFVRNDRFSAEFYPDGRPRLYATEATVIEGGRETRRYTIKMNEPLQYRGYALYQSSYSSTLGSAQVIVQKSGPEGGTVGSFTLDLYQPAAEYRLDGLTLKLADYFPDFAVEQGRPTTRSGEPNNPAAQFRVDGYGKVLWFFVKYPEMQFDPQAPYHFRLAELQPRNATGLRVKRDAGLPLIWTGLLVLSVGATLALWLAHRRVWALVSGARVLVAGQTNRDRLGLARELRRAMASLPAVEAEDF